jgi:hypothetical protein
MENFKTVYLRYALAQGRAEILNGKDVHFNGRYMPITSPLNVYPARFLVIHELFINDGYKSVLTLLLADFDSITARTLTASLIVLTENFIAGTPRYIFDDNNTYTYRHILGIQTYGEPLRKACSRLHSAILHGADFSACDIREFERIRLELSQFLSMTPISKQIPDPNEWNGL